jgi:D-amino peptidase
MDLPFMINGPEHGELSQFAMYAGFYGIPLIYASGDEALCVEARRLFPGVVVTPTKQGTGWDTCALYPADQVRANIRRDMAQALKNRDRAKPWKPAIPAEIAIEWAWSGKADEFARHPGVERVDARTIRWRIRDARDVYSFPSAKWHP